MNRTPNTTAQRHLQTAIAALRMAEEGLNTILPWIRQQPKRKCKQHGNDDLALRSFSWQSSEHDILCSTCTVRVVLDQLVPLAGGDAVAPPATVPDEPRNPPGTEFAYIGLSVAQDELDALPDVVDAEDPLYRAAMAGWQMVELMRSVIENMRMCPKELIESEIVSLRAEIEASQKAKLAAAM